MKKIILSVIFVILVSFTSSAQFSATSLGRARPFTVLAGNGVFNAGDTKINGNVGVAPGTDFSGFPPGIIIGQTYLNQPASSEAQTDLAAAYTLAGSQTPTQNLTGQNLGGLTLKPGVYRFDNNADLTGTLTLDNGGDPNAVFIFQINGDFTVGSNGRVNFLELAQPRIRNVFWQVAGTATLGGGSTFRGSILGQQDIVAGSGSTIYGRLLSQNGSVTLTNNIITIPTDLSVVITKSPGNADGDYFIGDAVTYTITAHNAGPIGETNVRVRILNSGLTYISSTSSPGSTYNSATSQWNISNFPAGATATLELVTQINSNATAILVNNVTIVGDGLDEIRENNESSISICVAPSNLGEVSGPSSVCLGQEVVYSVTPINVASQYNWTVPTGWQIIGDASAASIRVIAGSLAGEVSVTAQNICSVSNPSSKQISTSTAPTPAPGSISPANGSINPCAGQENVTYTIEPVSGALSYAWILPEGWQILEGENTNSIRVRVGNTSGSVQVRTVNACGLSEPSTLAITVSVAPPSTPESVTGNQTPCVGEEVSYTVTGVTGATTFNWTFPANWEIKEGQGTATVRVLVGNTAGGIEITAINGCGTSQITLPVTPLTRITPNDISGPISPCASADGLVYTYSVPEVSGVTSYFWRVSGNLVITEGQGTASIKVRVNTTVTSGNIYVSTLNNCGQSPEKSITVTPITKPGRPTAFTNSTLQPCVGQEAVVYSIAPVTGATSYVWTLPTDWVISGPADGTSITVKAGSEAGNISVAAVNACGPGLDRTIAVTPSFSAPSAPLTITGTANPCVGQSGITYSVAPVADALEYIWEIPAEWVITAGQGTASIQVTAGRTSGTISVKAKNNCGISQATSLAVITSLAPAPAPAQIIASTQTPCINESGITYSIEPVNGAQSYEWTISDDWLIVGGQGTTSIVVTAGSGPGTISVRARNGCGLSDARSLTVQPATGTPTAPTGISGRTSVCINEANLTYTITPVAGASRYEWRSSDGWVITNGQGTTSIQVTAGTENGQISVIAYNNCGASSATVLEVQKSNAMPVTPGQISGSTAVCFGNTGVTYSIEAVPGALSYLWTVPTGWTITTAANGTSISVTVGSSSGKIKVKAINGCGESTESELNVSPTLSAPLTPSTILAGSATYCAGEAGVTYVVSPVAGATTYTWTVPQDWIITEGQGTNVITVTTSSIPGQVSVTASNNCGTSSASVLAVRPTAIPVAATSIQGNALPCAGSTANRYSVNEVPDATSYEWTVPAGWTISAGQGTARITVAAGVDGGQITVKASNACGSSSTTVLQVGTSTALPTTPLSITGNGSVCSGATNLVYSIQPVENTSNYIWSVPSGWTILSGQGSTSITVVPSNSPGTISVMAENGCGVSTARVLGVSVTGQMPSEPGTISGPLEACSNAQDVSYSVSAVSGASGYTWQVPDGWEITSGQGTAFIKVTTSANGGVISVIATNGCGSSTAKTMAVTMTTSPGKPLAITGEVNQCAGNRGKVYSIAAVTGATSYTWTVPAGWQITTGQGTASITVNAGQQSGEVTVAARNKCGASEASVLAVTSSSTVPPAPDQIKADASGLACSGQPGLTYSIDPVVTATSYVWQVPAGWEITSGQGTTAVVVKAGKVSGQIMVKAINGCGQGEASALMVSLDETPAAELLPIVGETNLCSGQTNIQYMVPAMAGATSYSWSVPEGWSITSGQGTNIITVTAGERAGSISVVASNACTSSMPQTLSLSPNLTPKTPVTIQELGSPCGGLQFAVAASAGATTYTWQVPNGWSITTGQGTGSIKVTAPAGSLPGKVSVIASSPTCTGTETSIQANPALADAGLEFANGLSPNGDNINDTWKIRNIENYPENDLVIINRWGSEVYRTKGYRSNWNGGELSGGTYFYVLNVKMCDGTYQTYKGYVMIIR